MTDHLDPVLVAKWLAGELTAAERHAVDDWLAGNPARRAELDELLEVWDRAGHIMRAPVSAEDNAAESERWNAIRHAIGDLRAVPEGRPHTRTIEFPLSRRVSRGRRWLVAAAAAIVLAIGGGTVWQAVRLAAPTAQVFAASAGAPRTVKLSDGSVVTLAAGSRLTFVEERRPGALRSATLDGQAFFAVVHDEERQFVVAAGDITTRVLGTEFNVRSYRGDESPSVAVRSGKVGVTVSRRGAVSDVVVTPGYEATVDGTGQIRVEAVDLGRTLAWTSGRLEFVGAELGMVLRDLNRWYGLRLGLTDTSVVHHRVTVVFDRATAEDVVATLRRLVGSGVLTSSPPPGSPQ